MTNSCAQVGLWPTLEGGFSVVDAHAIKVSGYHNANFSGSIETDE